MKNGDTVSAWGYGVEDDSQVAICYKNTEFVLNFHDKYAQLSVYNSENGDLCATYVAASMYGTNTWDGGLANQMWNGRFYEVQTEWDNHTGGCAQVGP